MHPDHRSPRNTNRLGLAICVRLQLRSHTKSTTLAGTQGAQGSNTSVRLAAHALNLLILSRHASFNDRVGCAAEATNFQRQSSKHLQRYDTSHSVPLRHNSHPLPGPNALKDYFDPDCAPPLPLVELSSRELNPFYDDGVRIYAKMMSCHPANNVKSMPGQYQKPEDFPQNQTDLFAAMNLLAKEIEPEKTKTIIEYSSGSTVISMSMVARVMHGLDDTRAFLSNKTSEAKLRLMQFFGLKL